MNDELEALISRYLDGTITRGDVRRLDERVREDPAARCALFLAAAQDALVREVLASEAASEARPARGRRRWMVGAVAAAAAVVLAAVGLVLFWDRYPPPQVSGSYTVVGGGEVRRGCVLRTGAEPATLTLGGYCRVHIDPGSTLRVEGKKRAEQVFLDQGGLVCEVNRDVGTFDVLTAVGTVSVTGTRFTVRMVEEKGDEEMFGKRMLVRVMAGAVLVSGGWGAARLEAGEEATLPRPEAVVRRILDGLDLSAAARRKAAGVLAGEEVAELRAAYRVAVRGRLFNAAHTALRAAMAKAMPKKVQAKVQAIRTKLRAGPPRPGDIARIRLAVMQRTRKIMMKKVHETADRLADEAAKDDRLAVWVLAQKVRAKLPPEKVAAFDAALKEAGASDTEPSYIARAKTTVDSTIKSYDPDISGIVDPKTGKVTVSDKDVGVTLKDDESGERIAKMLRGALAGLEIPMKTMAAIGPMLSTRRIETERANYFVAVRTRLFDAARKQLETLMPKTMALKAQAKVTAIRTGLRAAGPPSAADRARIQRAVMKRSRKIMMATLHGTADAVAAKAVKDERLVAAVLAKEIRAKLPPDTASAFDAALKKAGITGDESACLAEAEQAIKSAIEGYDPDLSGIVDPKTGKVIAKDED